MSRTAIALCFAWLLAACERRAESTPRAFEAAVAPQRTERLPSGATPTPPARAMDPALRPAISAFEGGDLARSEALRLAAGEGLDRELLGARILAARGDEIGAVRIIEALRARHPGCPGVHATAAEIHAAAGRLQSAEDEIREGLASAGSSAELTRARGVLALCREGGARTGLEHLLAARTTDPELAFLAVPLAQAHVLLGNAALANENVAEAAGHARAALVALPSERDATQLLADAHAAVGEFEPALALYEQLLGGGLDVRGNLAGLYARAATAALLLPKGRELAVERYVRARELGLSDDELGFGATLLEQCAEPHVTRGYQAYDAGDFAAARAAFEAALRFQPHSIELHNHLGVVHFREQHFDAAAGEWRRVLELAAQRGIALPEPVHLNLARALHQCGRRAEIRPLLDAYLAREPQGEFAAETRAMLARLDSDADGR